MRRGAAAGVATIFQPVGMTATLVLPANALPAGVTSAVRLIVTASDGAASAALSTTVVEDVLPPLEPIVATISGGSERATGVSEALSLDASTSSDPSFPDAFPHFGTDTYWENETRDLEEQLDRIRGGQQAGEAPGSDEGGSAETHEGELTNEDFFWDL